MAVIACSGAAGLGVAHFTVCRIVSCHHHDRMNSTSESSSPTVSPTILHPYERLKVLSTQEYPAVLPFRVCIDDTGPITTDRCGDYNLFQFTSKEWRHRRIYFDPGVYQPPPAVLPPADPRQAASFFKEAFDNSYQFVQLERALREAAKCNNFQLIKNGYASHLPGSRRFVCNQAVAYKPKGGNAADVAAEKSYRAVSIKNNRGNSRGPVV
jgi:hypothetical protein